MSASLSPVFRPWPPARKASPLALARRIDIRRAAAPRNEEAAHFASSFRFLAAKRKAAVVAMITKSSLYGSGPRILGPLYLGLALGLGLRFWGPPWFHAEMLSAWPARALGAGMALAGAGLWAWGMAPLRKALAEGRLLVSGAYALCRHPLYAAQIELFVPGIALALGAWPGLLAPLAGLAAFRVHIGSEEMALLSRFGADYASYRRRTPALLGARR